LPQPKQRAPHPPPGGVERRVKQAVAHSRQLFAQGHFPAAQTPSGKTDLNAPPVSLPPARPARSHRPKPGRPAPRDAGCPFAWLRLFMKWNMVKSQDDI